MEYGIALVSLESRWYWFVSGAPGREYSEIPSSSCPMEWARQD
ncbi:hypothetical protein [uncultured Dialister sp.]|nr:hypothetical protein [uncultured Dialister sp.]